MPHSQTGTNVETKLAVLPPRSGTAFYLRQGQRLRVVDIEGEQVSDFFCFAAGDHHEYLSSGRTFDYLESIYLGQGDTLYSSKSRPMAKILEDTVGCHDFLLTPCSKDTFSIIYGDKEPHPGCEGNLLKAFKEHDVHMDCLPATFNIFMRVKVGPDGAFKVEAPFSRAGDYIVLEALQDLLVGLTACSAAQSNNGSFKPIGYAIL